MRMWTEKRLLHFIKDIIYVVQTLPEHRRCKRTRGLDLAKMDKEIALPVELVDRIDEVMEVMGFRTREELVIAAVRRLLDFYKSMALMEAQS
jgi:hypothetical protein